MSLNLGELNAVIDADDRGFTKAIDRVHRELDGTAKKLDQVSNRLGGLRGLLSVLGKATAFAGIATGAAGAASALGPVVGLAGTLLTTAGGLAAVLPAALLAGAAAAATLKIGLLGVGEAIAGDEEALDRLPGPAKEFVQAVRDLKPAWDDVTKSIQSKLFEGVADVFERTAGTILPRLKTGLGFVADGWNDVFKAGLKASTGTRFMSGLDAVLTSTGKGLTSMAKGLDGWLRGLGILLSAVAPLLEDMGEAAGDLGDRFGEWMEQARASGQLQSTLQTMLDTLSTLGGIAQNVGGIFSSVFSSANESGGGLLGTVETLTGRLDEFLKSTDGQSALGTFFDSLSDVADAVAPIVGELARVIGEDLAPKIADIAEGAGPSFRDLVEEIGDFIGKIDAKNLADGLVDVLDAVTPLIDPLGDLVGGISGLDGIVPVAAISLGIFTVAVWALNTALWANPIVWIIALVIALIAIIVLAILNWDKIVLAFQVGWDLVVAKFEDAKSATVLIFQQIGDWISRKVDGVMAAIDIMKRIPVYVTAWFARAKDGIVDKLTAAVDWVKGIPGKVKSALGDLGSLLYNAGKDILQGLIDGIESKWSAVESKFGQLTSMIPDWKGPESVDRDLLKGPAEWIIGGFAEHLESMFPLVHKTLSGLTSDIGLSVDGAAAPMSAPMRVEATASLSAEDRELLRELAEARNVVQVELGANLSAQQKRRNSMVVS